MKEMDRNWYVFSFFMQLLWKCILQGGPWTSDNQFLLVKELLPGDQPLHVILTDIVFWLQVYDVL